MSAEAPVFVMLTFFQLINRDFNENSTKITPNEYLLSLTSVSSYCERKSF